MLFLNSNILLVLVFSFAHFSKDKSVSSFIPNAVFVTAGMIESGYHYLENEFVYLIP